jgi:hypothetical protein
MIQFFVQLISATNGGIIADGVSADVNYPIMSATLRLSAEHILISASASTFLPVTNFAATVVLTPAIRVRPFFGRRLPNSAEIDFQFPHYITLSGLLTRPCGMSNDLTASLSVFGLR